MPDLTVRATTLADLQAVGDLLADSYPHLLKTDYAPALLARVLPIIVKAQPALVGCGTYYAVEGDGVLLGVGGWTRDRKEPALGHIRHVATHSAALRRGVGRLLMTQCFDAARAAGITRMECWATYTAVPFYKAVGFEEGAPFDVPLADCTLFPSLRMHMRL